ncbi:MAG TPA: cyclodeaminase/cyclohydrolase family protein [bacterium]|nr:cyclodeaminase/cyclohydrolase family protein [bacterium]
MLIEKKVTEFLDELASSAPAPGGGSVAALAAALGAALTAMVAQLTIGKKKYADVEPIMQEISRKAETLRRDTTALIDKDTIAFNAVMTAFAMPKETDEQKQARASAIESATQNATRIPLDVMKLCASAIGLTHTVVTRGNTNALSDGGVGALMLQAACRGAYYNVMINLGGLKDAAFVSAIQSEAQITMKTVDDAALAISQHVGNQFGV